MMRRISVIVIICFLIVASMLSAGCANKKSERIQFNEYEELLNQVQNEEEWLTQTIDEARELGERDTSDYVDAPEIEDFKRCLDEAMRYNLYVDKGLTKGDKEIENEIPILEERYFEVQTIRMNLSDSIYYLTELIESEDTELTSAYQVSQVWPAKEHSWENKDFNGYVIEYKVRFSSILKASDKENIDMVWEQIGGTGEAPTIESFDSKNKGAFRDDKAAIVFGTIELTNKTEGYDFSEAYPYKTSLTDLIIPVSEYPASLNEVIGYTGQMFFSNGPAYFYRGVGSSVSMRSNKWGPVPIAIALTNIFGPNFDEDGNDALDELYFYCGKDKVFVPCQWKDNSVKNTLRLYEMDYFSPLKGGYDVPRWSCYKGKLLGEKWCWTGEKYDTTGELVLNRLIMAEDYFDISSNAECTFNTDDRYTIFKGDIAVSVGGVDNSGYTIIRIWGDETLLYDSGNITGSSGLTHFDLDITGVRRIKIESVTDENKPGPCVAIVNDEIS